MILTDQIVEEALVNPNLNGSRSHWIADCPFCNKKEHLYVQTQTHKTNSRGENVSWMFECKKCQEVGKIFRLLRALGRDDIIQNVKQISVKSGLNIIKLAGTENPYEKKIEEVFEECPSFPKPLGYKRVFDDPYFNSRGFTKDSYEVYNVGRSTLLEEMRRYVFILVIENGECKGYVGRLALNKKQQQELEEKLGYRIPRYMNSVSEFSNLILGYDEITDNTEELIMVEGPFDKSQVDKNMELFLSEKVKCVCTFGKKLSAKQIYKIKKKKGVKKITLMYDPDAVETSKKTLQTLKFYFENVEGVLLSQKDPGDMDDRDEMVQIFSQKYKANEFALVVQKKVLK